MELDRRRPGVSSIASTRKERDRVELLSGLFEGVTTGAPIGFIIRNEDARDKDYKDLKDIFRPSHADYTYSEKYAIRDYRGSGRASARETACRVVGGAIARQVLGSRGISVWAYTSQVGKISLKKPYTEFDRSVVYANEARCPDPLIAETMQNKIKMLRKEGDSIGGVVTGVITGLPAGLGEPVFNKLHAALGGAMLGINAVRGFEIGSGFIGATMKGSAHNDVYCMKDGRMGTETNNSGGIQGGISNGMDVYFRVAFKPTPTILKAQKTVNTAGEEVTFKAKGRHDPCVVPRAVPVVEAMAALVMADQLLLNRTSQIQWKE